MSEAKHSPGNWKIWKRLSENVYIDSGAGSVCKIAKNRYEGGNARLIAAAPELVEALQYVYNYLIGLHAYLLSCEKSVIVDNLETTSASAYRQAELADAAIKKARGEQ